MSSTRALLRLLINTVLEVTVYITDATHFLDDNGAIGPQSGPGRKMADFFGTVIVAATLRGAEVKPACFKCSGVVETHSPAGKVIEWLCSECGESGRISNWEGTLWDMTAARNAHSARH